MTYAELLLTAAALSMDAFAVSACKGLNMRGADWRYALVIALFFGGFQAAMPLAGWFLGKQFESLITNVDHWIVFALLAFLGGKMIFDALKGRGGEACATNQQINFGELAVLALATSIDALAVGISFAFLGVQILPAVLCIGLTTFLLSLGGVAVGWKFGVKYQRKATFAGGLVLILLGLKILFEHLGILL
jgi:putative Mn2+ efflux pump MntP